MTVSLWRRTSALGTITTDTAVIGAGVAGLSASLALQRRGIDNMIIERYAMGAGASSRNAGFLMRGAADNYAAAINDWGRPMAQRIWRMTEENLAGLRAEGIEQLPSYRAMASCLLALEEHEHAELRESMRLLEEDNFNVHWLDAHTDLAWRHTRPLGGLLNPNDATINPVELLALLRSRLALPILEGQELFEIVADTPYLHLRTTDAEIRCHRVLVCTNAYVGTLFPDLASLVVPNRGQQLALACGEDHGARLDFAYYANHGGEYFRQPAPGIINLGGWRRYFENEERTLEDRTTDNVQQGLEDFAEKMFGRRFPVIARWSGTMGFTPDGLPRAGPIPGYSPGSGAAGNVWFCGGFTGHGMSLGYRTANHAVAAMLGEEQPIFPLSRS